MKDFYLLQIKVYKKYTPLLIGEKFFIGAIIKHKETVRDREREKIRKNSNQKRNKVQI